MPWLVNVGTPAVAFCFRSGLQGHDKVLQGFSPREECVSVCLTSECPYDCLLDLYWDKAVRSSGVLHDLLQGHVRVGIDRAPVEFYCRLPGACLASLPIHLIGQ